MDFKKLDSILESGDRTELDAFCEANNLVIKNNKIFHKNPDLVDQELAFWDKRQLVKKINLNSLYGAILNAGCRFFDKRIGQSTTLSGRTIVKHMNAFVNESITGEYDYRGDATIYSDTDSAYFSAWPMFKAEAESGRMVWDKDTCIEVYDTIADAVNESFPAFMERAFHCPRDMGAIIRGGRELVASKGLFIKKKRYAVLIYDLEGKRQDVGGKPGKLKAMGLDLKRADTPKIVQDFLSDILLDVLTGSTKDDIVVKVREFKHKFKALPAWEKGTPKRVNNLTKYREEEERLGKANMPGHVRAAVNWNALKRMMSDNHSMTIVDGMKTIVCKLKDNPLGLTSVGYPIDENRIPQWFKELPFDDNLMETTIVDQKVENLFGVLDWNIAASTDIVTTFDTLFTWE
jgi:DNA polymerase elongation subunit (family B)